jgi:uncharacterized coiled-coil DUF342 family protein
MKSVNTLVFFSFFFLGIVSCTVSDPEMLDLLKEMNSQNKELLEEVKSLKSKSDSLINEIKANSAKQEELLNKVISLQAEIGKVVQEITKLSEELKNQGADIDSIKAQLADLQKKYEEIIIQLEQLQSLSKILGEIEILKAQLLELDKKYESVILSLGQNKDQIDQLKTKIDTIQKQLEENLTKISQLTTQLSASDSNVESILSQIAQLQINVNQLLANFQELLGITPNAQGTITSLDCVSTTNVGSLVIGQNASNVNTKINYQGGNGKAHTGQTVVSTGVLGLTATLAAGTFATGNGTLTYVITGTPATSGVAKFAINIGGKTCEISRSVASTNSNISALNCNTAVNTGATGQLLNKLVKGYAIPGAKTEITYLGGDGSNHTGQTVNSTGVTGLTATLLPGKFNFGTGSLVFTISGIPTSFGKANFELSIGGQTCVLSWDVNDNQASRYPNGTVFCEFPTEIVEVVNPKTGKIWMDRNLGARRAAVAIAARVFQHDTFAYGDLYQWGRRADGHQCRNSEWIGGTTDVDQPPHGKFYHGNWGTSAQTIPDWRFPTNPNLWQGVNGINNPCPNGFRIPTPAEMIEEFNSWSSTTTGFNSILKIPFNGFREPVCSPAVCSAGIKIVEEGSFWLSEKNGSFLNKPLTNGAIAGTGGSSSNKGVGSREAAYGIAVRCIKD